MTPTFIGIDLAWQSDKNHSGVAVLRGDNNGAELFSYSTGLTTLMDVANYVLANATANSAQ